RRLARPRLALSPPAVSPLLLGQAPRPRRAGSARNPPRHGADRRRRRTDRAHLARIGTAPRGAAAHGVRARGEPRRAPRRGACGARRRTVCHPRVYAARNEHALRDMTRARRSVVGQADALAGAGPREPLSVGVVRWRVAKPRRALVAKITLRFELDDIRVV